MAWYNPLSWGGGDPTSFTSMGGSYNPGKDLAFEGINGKQDSQTQMQRSLQNYGAQQGKELTESGRQTLGKGKDDLTPVLDYFHRLLGGDRAEMMGAIQPEADTISQQFGQIRQMFANNGARGGGRTSTLAQLPTQQSTAVTSMLNRSRANAAGQGGQLALGEADMGVKEAALGSQELQQVMQLLLGIRGQDKEVDTANRKMLTSGLTSVLAEPLSDAAGASLKNLLF